MDYCTELSHICIARWLLYIPSVSHLHTHAVATTCLRWSWRLTECFCTRFGSKRRGRWMIAKESYRLGLCHADESWWGRSSCPWLPLPGWYGCAILRRWYMCFSAEIGIILWNALFPRLSNVSGKWNYPFKKVGKKCRILHPKIWADPERFGSKNSNIF